MDWKIVADYGVALGILLLLMAGLWRILVWLANNVILPVVRAHIEFLKMTGETLLKQSLILEKIDNQLNLLIKVIQDHQTWLINHEKRVIDEINKEIACPMKPNKQEKI